MLLNTKHFGDIEINEQDIIKFKEGIPGFDDKTQFVLLSDEDNIGAVPFYWLQSVNDAGLAFVLIDAMGIMPDYTPEINEVYLVDMGDYDNDKMLILNMIAIPDDFKKATVNLLAPIIINNKEKLGKQIIAENSNLTTKHLLFSEVGLKDGGE